MHRIPLRFYRGQHIYETALSLPFPHTKRLLLFLLAGYGWHHLRVTSRRICSGRDRFWEISGIWRKYRRCWPPIALKNAELMVKAPIWQWYASSGIQLQVERF
jgi:hypothetical protein